MSVLFTILSGDSIFPAGMEFRTMPVVCLKLFISFILVSSTAHHLIKLTRNTNAAAKLDAKGHREDVY